MRGSYACSRGKGWSVALCVIAVSGGWAAEVVAGESGAPPWTPQYKIKPHQTERLTPADAVGPDGIVYPDWRYAGVPGGIPQVPVVARIEEFGAKVDDDRDDSAALAAGVREVFRRGGGALELAAGNYHLDRPVLIPYDGVVIRGRGMENTKLVFRYGPASNGVGFFSPKDGDVVGPDTPIEVHASPDDLKRIAVQADDTVLAERVYGPHWGGTYAVRLFGSDLVRRVGAGQRTLTGIAEWSNGRRAETRVTVTLDARHRSTDSGRRLASSGLAAIMFHGDGHKAAPCQLAKDGKRGDRQVVLSESPDLKPGDAVELDAPATPRWNTLLQNACKWGTYRRGQFRVEKVVGNVVQLNQPLRIDFPVIDGSTLEKLDPIRGCGVERLSLTQTEKLWTCGILFDTAWACWAREVKVVKSGQHAIYTRRAKWCEIRDCELDDAWYHGGGGTAYVGWERSYDCLMENVTTWRMRHAPCVQWSSSGNVIRKSTFHGSDAQWHAGWTNENLFEQCVVDAAGTWGSYGHGGWASPPQDEAHGPEGPRNVIYNCDLHGTKTGLWLGGMNENWLILHNRIVADNGPGVAVRCFSFDHIVRGNTIVLRRPSQSAVQLATADCVGVEIAGNQVFGGNGQLVSGPGKPDVANDNALLPLTDSAPRPQPNVPSIFEWQRNRPSERR